MYIKHYGTTLQIIGIYISLSQTKSILRYRFIRVGGYKLLNSWLTYSKTTTNTPMLQLILLTLQKLPLTVDHLKQVALDFTLPVAFISALLNTI